MTSRRTHSLLCEPSAGLFIVACLITSLIMITAWTALGIERGDGESPDRNNDAKQSLWSPTTLAAAAVVPSRYQPADSQSGSAKSGSRISGAAQRRLDEKRLMRSQRFEAAMLKIMTSLHDAPR